MATSAYKSSPPWLVNHDYNYNYNLNAGFSRYSYMQNQYFNYLSETQQEQKPLQQAATAMQQAANATAPEPVIANPNGDTFQNTLGYNIQKKFSLLFKTLLAKILHLKKQNV